METPADPPNDPDRMRLVGGDLALDFANTRAGPPTGPAVDDLLERYEDVLAWARHVGAIDEAVAVRLRNRARRDRAGSAAAYDRAVGLRDLVDGVFRSLAHGRPVPSESLETLTAWEAASISRATLRRTNGGFAWSWAADRSLERPLGPIVHAAVDLLTRGPLDRVKACGGCSFLFLDESKNRSRRWCSMDDCGSTEKVRRFVARRRQSARAGTPSSADRRMR